MLFIRTFVFFIHDNQAEVLEWKKHRGPGSNDNSEFVGVIGMNLIPDFHAFVLVEFGVIYAKLLSKILFQAMNQLSG